MNFPRSAARAGWSNVAAGAGRNVKGDRPHANPLRIRVAIIIFKREVAHIPPRCVEAPVKMADFEPFGGKLETACAGKHHRTADQRAEAAENSRKAVLMPQGRLIGDGLSRYGHARAQRSRPLSDHPHDKDQDDRAYEAGDQITDPAGTE
jgi:hypothetical protein